MKLKYDFEKVELGEETMAVAVGEGAKEFHSMLRLNETAAVILDLLKTEMTLEEVQDEVLKQYDGDEAEIKKYVAEYITKLDGYGIIEK